MRWLFLGLIIINAFYFIWSQQDFGRDKAQLPVVEKSAGYQLDEVTLLSEAPLADRYVGHTEDGVVQADVLLLGGFNDEGVAQNLQQRLLSLDIESKVRALDSEIVAGYLQDIHSDVSMEEGAHRAARRSDSSIDALDGSHALYWVVISARSQRLVGQELLKQLLEDFPDIKYLSLPSDKIKR